MMLYGEAPTNGFEEWFTLLLLTVTVGIFAYILAKVEEVMNDLNA